MKTIVGSITQRGQVTIPAEVRKILGVEPRGKVAFEIVDNQVRLVPLKYTLESAFGAVKPPTSTKDLNKAIKDAKEEKVDRDAELYRS